MLPVTHTVTSTYGGFRGPCTAVSTLPTVSYLTPEPLGRQDSEVAPKGSAPWNTRPTQSPPLERGQDL